MVSSVAATLPAEKHATFLRRVKRFRYIRLRRRSQWRCGD
jgi:hypothetical protein